MSNSFVLFGTIKKSDNFFFFSLKSLTWMEPQGFQITIHRYFDRLFGQSAMTSMLLICSFRDIFVSRWRLYSRLTLQIYLAKQAEGEGSGQLWKHQPFRKNLRKTSSRCQIKRGDSSRRKLWWDLPITLRIWMSFAYSISRNCQWYSTSYDF